jgi:hypothetical protein
MPIKNPLFKGEMLALLWGDNSEMQINFQPLGFSHTFNLC